MGISYFVHIHGDQSQIPALRRTVEEQFAGIAGEFGASVVCHAPLVVHGGDPLPVDQDARALLCQISTGDAASARMRDGLASAIKAIANAKGVTSVSWQAMAAERIRPGAPDESSAPAEAVSFFVQYNGPAKDPAAFHAYYRAHHVPIVLRMPGIRSLTYFTPSTQAAFPIAGAVQYLQLVQAVFDSADDFLKMRQSAERREGLRDFDNYPAFEGPVTHQVMQSRRIGA